MHPGAGCGIIPAETPGEAPGRKARACRAWPCKDGLPGRAVGKNRCVLAGGSPGKEGTGLPGRAL